MKLYTLIIMIMLVTFVAHAQEIGDPIPMQDGAEPVEAFIGSAATPQPIETTSIPRHPSMATSGTMHNDIYMSDTYNVQGPLGQNLEVLSSYLGELCVTMTFDQQGRIITLCLALDAAQLFLIDPVTLLPLAVMDLPAKQVTDFTEFSAGSYFYLDQNDHAMIPTIERTIWEVSVTDGNFVQEKVYDLSSVVTEEDTIGSILPDFAGNIWFVTHLGIVGVIDAETDAITSITLENEEIRNSFAIDETGGVFIASEHAMYRFDLNENGEPAMTWREAYDRGSAAKPGQTGQGSGTTPTLMGNDFVTITDNAEPQMNVLVFKRGVEVEGSRLHCSEPVFEPDASATENSLIATDTSIIVENNYGYGRPRTTMNGQSTTPGITRVDVDEDGCHTVWTNNERVPSVVSKLSLVTGLIYTYTKDEGPGTTDAWYFTAIDFHTGETVFKQLAGTGLLYNNHYAALYLGADGTAYVGVIGGIVAIRDTTE